MRLDTFEIDPRQVSYGRVWIERTSEGREEYNIWITGGEEITAERPASFKEDVQLGYVAYEAKNFFDAIQHALNLADKLNTQVFFADHTGR